MKKLASILSIVLMGLLASQAFAGDGHDHSSNKHCEKKVDGKTVHLGHVKNRKQCKQEGGRWVKHKEKDSHDHGSHKDNKDHKDGDGHQH